MKVWRLKLSHLFLLQPAKNPTSINITIKRTRHGRQLNMENEILKNSILFRFSIYDRSFTQEEAKKKSISNFGYCGDFHDIYYSDCNFFGGGGSISTK